MTAVYASGKFADHVEIVKCGRKADFQNHRRWMDGCQSELSVSFRFVVAQSETRNSNDSIRAQGTMVQFRAIVLFLSGRSLASLARFMNLNSDTHFLALGQNIF